MDLSVENKEVLGNFNMDDFRSKEDSDAVRTEAQKYILALNFCQGRDHGDVSLQQ